MWVMTGWITGYFGAGLGLFSTPYHIPTRARACNDLSEYPILLKTRSNRGSGIPRLNVFWTLSDRHTCMVRQFILVYTCIQYACRYMQLYDPKMGPPFWGILDHQISTSDHGIIQGRNVLDSVDHG